MLFNKIIIFWFWEATARKKLWFSCIFDEKVTKLGQSEKSIFLLKGWATESNWTDQTLYEIRTNSISTLTTLFLHSQQKPKKSKGGSGAGKNPEKSASNYFFSVQGTPVRYETSAARSPSPSSNTESSRNWNGTKIESTKTVGSIGADSIKKLHWR